MISCSTMKPDGSRKLAKMRGLMIIFTTFRSFSLAEGKWNDDRFVDPSKCVGFPCTTSLGLLQEKMTSVWALLNHRNQAEQKWIISGENGKDRRSGWWLWLCFRAVVACMVVVQKMTNGCIKWRWFDYWWGMEAKGPRAVGASKFFEVFNYICRY